MKGKEYIVEFNKLKNGLNTLNFSINNMFLSEMGSIDQYNARINAVVTVLKTENMYDMQLDFSGTATLTCDVCLEEFGFPVKGQSGLIIKVSEVERYDDDEIVYITPATIEYDLSQFLFDGFMLSLPLKRTCSMGDKTCNEEVIRKLSDLNEIREEENNETTDPRWDKLKDITLTNINNN